MPHQPGIWSTSRLRLQIHDDGVRAWDTQTNGYVYLFEPGINEWNWKASASFSL